MGSLRGIPIRLHWSIPLGCILLSGIRFAPAFWVAFFLLVFAHEIGHAVVVRGFRHRTLSIDVTGFGGVCRWSGHASGFERSAIAWGGVLMQMVLLVLTLVLAIVLGLPTNRYASQVFQVLTRSNIILIVINMLPVAPFDGAEAWGLFRTSRFKNTVASLRSRIPKLSWKRPPSAPPHKNATVVDLEAERHKRTQERGGYPLDKKRSTRELADELIRLSEEAARARSKRNDN